LSVIEYIDIPGAVLAGPLADGVKAHVANNRNASRVVRGPEKAGDRPQVAGLMPRRIPPGSGPEWGPAMRPVQTRI
jgi:hypothetical protein